MTQKVADGDKIDFSTLRYEIHVISVNKFQCTCPLRFYGGIRPNEGSHFVGYASCPHPNCGRKFRFDIFEIDSSIISVTMYANETRAKNHNTSALIPYLQVRGPKRTAVRTLLKYSKARKVHLENNAQCDVSLAKDGNVGLAMKMHVVNKIKSELRIEDKLECKSRDINDIAQYWIDQHKLKNPAVRLFQLPLKILIWVKDQLQAFIDGKGKIVHFDSTKAMCRKIEHVDTKMIMYYTLVWRGRESTIPLLESISDNHDIPSVEITLKLYKNFVHKTINYWPPFKAVVLDWSWVFMNSFLFEWNEGMTMTEYLEETYAILTRKKLKRSDLIVLLSCNAHIIRRFLKVLKKELNLSESQIKFLLECFAQLILCRTLDELSLTFEQILNVTLEKDEEKANDSLIYLSGMNKKKKEVIDKMMENVLDDEELDEMNENFLDMHKNSKTICERSPFYEHFWKILMRKENNLLTNSDEDITNDYYVIEFGRYVVKTFLSYAPLIGALMIPFVDDSVSRVSNAFAESYINTYKHTILQLPKDNAIGEIVREVVKYNKGLIVEEILDIHAKSTIAVQKRPHYPEAASNPFEIEKWGRSKKEIEKQSVKPRKHTCYEGRELVSIGQKIVNRRNNLKNKNKRNSRIQKRNTKPKQIKNSNLSAKMKLKGFNILKPKKVVEKNNKNINEKVIKQEKEKLLLENVDNFTIEYRNEDLLSENVDNSEIEYEKEEQLNISDANTCTIENDNEKLNKDNETILRKTHEIKNNIDILPNGLINSVWHYVTSSSESIKIGIYEPNTNITLVLKEFQMSAKQFSPVVRKLQWIDSTIVDCFTTTHMNSWTNKEVTYMPTDIANKAIGSYATVRKSPLSELYTIKTPINKILLMPYMFDGHCSLLCVDTRNYIYTLLDPYENSIDEGRAIKEFKNYINSYGYMPTATQKEKKIQRMKKIAVCQHLKEKEKILGQ
ncbi:uncharacterized protein LOC122504094 [Leptopilina heterotoma]|uniref:uncharacterized protein LOC122504094 n=1 Tax=Leptopilina heterotoma TaxID=63436 RepID=UPI001CA8E57B|nr:uncharacterized protein LOC122504094 [Leptopilina heterotoma]